MGRIEKTVFISYRRTNVPWALAIYQNLTMHGYDVFFDYQSIDSGNFEKVILENIKARGHFLVILTPSALERCKESGDWLRREIETAMDEKRNIVPLMLESFDFGSPIIVEALSGKLSALNKFNGLRVYSEYFFEAMDKLRDRYLSVEVSGISLPFLNLEAKEITETQKTAASEAMPVEEGQLTAQEWFERGYVLMENENFDEAIRCYSEAIRLEPDNFEAYGNRGIVYAGKGDLDRAIADYNTVLKINPEDIKAYHHRGNARRDRGELFGAIEDYSQVIRLKPDDADGYNDRGNARQLKSDLAGALDDFSKVVRLQPDYATAKSSLAGVLRKLGRDAEADEQERLARPLMQRENEYNQACFEAICGNVDKALELLKIGLEKKQAIKQWARQDPDFESIRDDPRFKEIVGE